MATITTKLAPGQTVTIPAAALTAHINKFLYGARIDKALQGFPLPTDFAGFDLSVPAQPTVFPNNIPVDGVDDIAVSASRMVRLGNYLGAICDVIIVRSAGANPFRLAFARGLGSPNALNANDQVGPDGQNIPPVTKFIGDAPVLGGAGVGPYTGNLTNGGSLPLHPLDPGTFRVRLNGVEIGFDDGRGGIQPIDGVPNPLVAGTINYDTGAVSVTFTNAIVGSDVISFEYFALDPIVEIEYTT